MDDNIDRGDSANSMFVTPQEHNIKTLGGEK